MEEAAPVFVADGIVIRANAHLVHVQCRHWDDEVFEGHIRAARELLRTREEPFVALIDLDGAQNPTGEERQELVRMWQDFAAPMEGKLVAIAYVVTSRFMRGVLQIFSWFQGPPAPSRVFATKAEAELWLEINLDARMAFDEAG